MVSGRCIYIYMICIYIWYVYIYTYDISVVHGVYNGLETNSHITGGHLQLDNSNYREIWGFPVRFPINSSMRMVCDTQITIVSYGKIPILIYYTHYRCINHDKPRSLGESLWFLWFIHHHSGTTSAPRRKHHRAALEDGGVVSKRHGQPRHGLHETIEPGLLAKYWLIRMNIGECMGEMLDQIGEISVIVMMNLDMEKSCGGSPMAGWMEHPVYKWIWGYPYDLGNLYNYI